MKRIFLLLPLMLVGCSLSQKITYRTDDLSAPETVKTLPAMVEVRIFTDNRLNVPENGILFNNPRQFKLDDKWTCINSEKHYKKDSVSSQITRIMVDHFNKARLFNMTFYKNSPYSNYYLTGTLNSFYCKQEWSRAAAVGSQFGLVGALATSGIKTPGIITIDISDLKLYKKDGTLVRDFGNFYKEYKEDFSADGYCWCAYWNSNKMLKDFNTQLIEKIRTDLTGVALE